MSQAYVSAVDSTFEDARYTIQAVEPVLSCKIPPKHNKEPQYVYNFPMDLIQLGRHN
jgi:hypothetical protein